MVRGCCSLNHRGHGEIPDCASDYASRGDGSFGAHVNAAGTQNLDVCLFKSRNLVNFDTLLDVAALATEAVSYTYSILSF